MGSKAAGVGHGDRRVPFPSQGRTCGLPVRGSITVELNRGHSLGGRQDRDILLASAIPSTGITGRYKALPGNSGMVGPLRTSPTSPVSLISFVSDLDSSLAVGSGPASEGATDDLPVAKAHQGLGAMNDLMSLQPDTDAISSFHGARVMRPGSPTTLLGKAAHHPMAGRCSQVLKSGWGQLSSCLLPPFPVPPILGHLPDYRRA